ncbi:hypothetical protein [Archaeoglobus sp.]
MKRGLMAGFLALVVLAAGITPVMAKAFTGEANDLAAALLKNTISNLEISNEFLDILNNASANMSATEPLFQNLWGVVYGALVVSAWNNQITGMVLDNISSNSTLTVKIGLAFSYLGSNSSTVFGPMNASGGIAMLLKNQTDVLPDATNYPYDASGKTYLEAYADVLTDTIMHNVIFMIKLFNEFTNAWS